jgi:hypothetical protein
LLLLLCLLFYYYYCVFFFYYFFLLLFKITFFYLNSILNKKQKIISIYIRTGILNVSVVRVCLLHLILAFVKRNCTYF